MLRRVWNDIVSWETNLINNTPCIDDHQFKEEDLKSVGALSDVCSQMVLTCLYLARIGKTWMFHGQSTNLLVRSQSGQELAKKRLARLMSYIHRTSEYKQCCHVGNTALQCRLGLCQDSDFAGDLEDSKSTSGGTLCIFWKPHTCPIKLDVQETDMCITLSNRV